MSEDAKNRIEKLFREAAPILKKSEQTQVPPHVLAKLQAAKEKKFPTRRELTAKQLGPLLLSVLAKGQMDGFEIISRLAKANLQIIGGEAVAYGSLSDLVSAGHAQVDLEERSGQMRKLYRLTENGRTQLQTIEVTQFNTLAAVVLAAG